MLLFIALVSLHQLCPTHGPV